MAEGEETAQLELLHSLLAHQSFLLPTSTHAQPFPTASTLPLNIFHPLFPQMLQQQLLNYNLVQLVSSMLASPSTMPPLACPSIPEEGESAPSTAAPLLPEPSPDSSNLVVPNDDKEGWCRNKKYIEKVAGGFMCLVCRKVYGRYNSVSYHVTIYHRNPPIKCDMEGCDFTTREARYIHFHKYYRHGIGLPRSIDQGSRRCLFCKHISKSPAMLEKHMKRHGDVGSLGERAWVDQGKKDDEDSAMLQGGRSRAVSECVSMDGIEETKPRSFTL